MYRDIAKARLSGLLGTKSRQILQSRKCAKMWDARISFRNFQDMSEVLESGSFRDTSCGRHVKFSDDQIRNGAPSDGGPDDEADLAHPT